MWTAGVLIALVLASAGVGSAVLYQRSVSAPVGEGELFKHEASSARAGYQELVVGGSSPDHAVRVLRNELGIEAVGVVDATGRFVASTSPEQQGTETELFLRQALEEGRFAAIAVSLTHELSVDGVVEWQSGSVVYEVAEPFADGGGVVLAYDLAELLARRSQDAALRPLAVQLGVGGFLAAVLAAALWFARNQAKRRVWEANRETELLEIRSRDLERHNKELEVARKEAERALALAEETNRIRSEFVLMINHELRTPLTSVVTGAELLLDQPEMPLRERVELTEHLVTDGKRLIELMSQMLTVARVENRGLQFRLTDSPADQILRRLAGRRDWLEVDAGPLVTVETDMDALVQLIQSLADNARSHGATQIRVSCQRELPFVPDHTVGDAPSDPVYFLISDDGPGIDPDFLPRAFEKFEKRGRSSGTGLGLYLVRMMAEAIDGYLAVSTGASGTTMAVGVPAGAAVLEHAG